MSILGLLLLLIVLCLVLWAANAIMAAFSIGDPIRTLIWVAIVVIAVLYVVNALGGLGLGSVRIR